ncbi:hypothetical protein TrVGV298_003868 [Trichoderma virens]|nr:hypothetical protein TrVGV298_003868 [Trichoderma virens]
MFILLLGIACLTVKSRLPPRRRRFVPNEYVRHFEDIRLFSTITGVFLFQLGMVVPFRYVTLPAKEAGFSPDLIPYLLPIFSAISVFGRIFLSVAADNIGGFNVVTTITFVSATFCLTAPTLVESMADIIVYVVIFGFFSGGVISLVPTLVAQISDIRHIGTRVGSAFAIQATGALIGSPIVSAILRSRRFNHHALQLLCGFSILLGCVGFVWARYTQVGFKLVKV